MQIFVLKNAKMPLIFISTVFTFVSARMITDHANSKIHRFKILQFLFSQNQHGRKNLHRAKISWYTRCFIYSTIKTTMLTCGGGRGISAGEGDGVLHNFPQNATSGGCACCHPPPLESRGVRAGGSSWLAQEREDVEDIAPTRGVLQ